MPIGYRVEDLKHDLPALSALQLEELLYELAIEAGRRTMPRAAQLHQTVNTWQRERLERA
jgi:hypothetical protein